MDTNGQRTSAVCESQPVTAGLHAILNQCNDMTSLGRTESLPAASELVRQLRPDVCLVDKSFGDAEAVMDWVSQAKMLSQQATEIVVWGVSITEAEALRFLQSGAKCAQNLGRFDSCRLSRGRCERIELDGGLRFSRFSPDGASSRSELTPREQQVLELVEQGMKNKEIARELGIRPGTVKIHLKHIFEKPVSAAIWLGVVGHAEKGLLEMAPVS